jgi:hypothetical protein
MTHVPPRNRASSARRAPSSRDLFEITSLDGADAHGVSDTLSADGSIAGVGDCDRSTVVGDVEQPILAFKAVLNRPGSLRPRARLIGGRVGERGGAVGGESAPAIVGAIVGGQHV